MQVKEARFFAGAAEAGRLPRAQGPEIAFAGRSNVGKSTLLNALTGRHQLARVSKTPGRTQQINFFALDDRLVFVDLPGYGFARVPLAVKERWKVLVESYLASREALRGVVLIVDVRRGVQEDDAMLIDFLRASSIPVILVATKLDKLPRGQRQKALRQISLRPLRGVSAVVGFAAPTGEGVRELWREIEMLAGARLKGP